MQYRNKILGLGVAFTFASLAANAQDVAAPAEWSLGVNELLVGFALLLLLVIIALSATFLAALKHYKHNVLNKRTGTTLLVLLAMALPFASKAQEAGAEVAAVTAPSLELTENFVFRVSMYFIILLELLAIVLLAKYTRRLLQPERMHIDTEAVLSKYKIDWEALWMKFNKLKPMSREQDLDVGHSYDGIRELDNAAPPWFTIGFALTILVAIIYMYRFIGGSAPTQIEEYELSVAKAEEAKAIFMATQKDMVDENTVVLLDGDGIAAGKMLYATNCVACHGALGEGGVGPNLTDENWIHEGSLHSIFKSIKYGYPDKGMKSWKEDFSPIQMAQLTSYLHELKGTNPPGGKPPQGDIWKEEGGDVPKVAPGDPAGNADTTTAPAAAADAVNI